MSKRINRVKIEWSPSLTGDEYKLLDTILFRSALPYFLLRTKTLMKETGLNEDTILKIMSKWIFLRETKTERGLVWEFNYEGCLNVFCTPIPCTSCTPCTPVQEENKVQEVQRVQAVQDKPTPPTPCTVCTATMNENTDPDRRNLADEFESFFNDNTSISSSSRISINGA